MAIYLFIYCLFKCDVCIAHNNVKYRGFVGQIFEYLKPMKIILNDAIPLCTYDWFIAMWCRYTKYETVVILQLVKFGYMFRPLPGHLQANKEIVLIKVHSLALPIGSYCLH
jgi:hypothetical protein